jgi:putative glutamine amidotransferase
MTKPLIGLTTARQNGVYGYPMISNPETYIQALSQAGATPVLIPLGLPDETLLDILSRCDGILFTGGGDIHPNQYGGISHPKVSNVDTDRDRVETLLACEAINEKVPFLAICRGFQMINVALGGTLYEHIPDQHLNTIKHDYTPIGPEDRLVHEVKILEDTHLSHILGSTRIEVNSTHHQGIRLLADGLNPLAYAPDGIIEAFELKNHPFGLAVQWHPERLQSHAPMRDLFSVFVETASKHRK